MPVTNPHPVLPAFAAAGDALNLMDELAAALRDVQQSALSGDPRRAVKAWSRARRLAKRLSEKVEGVEVPEAPATAAAEN